jgi:hypothetical protein
MRADDVCARTWKINYSFFCYPVLTISQPFFTVRFDVKKCDLGMINNAKQLLSPRRHVKLLVRSDYDYDLEH